MLSAFLSSHSLWGFVAENKNQVDGIYEAAMSLFRTAFLPAHDSEYHPDTMPPMYATPTDIRSRWSIRARALSSRMMLLQARISVVQ